MLSVKIDLTLILKVDKLLNSYSGVAQLAERMAVNH
jgi:hypothetical protein